MIPHHQAWKVTLEAVTRSLHSGLLVFNSLQEPITQCDWSIPQIIFIILFKIVFCYSNEKTTIKDKFIYHKIMLCICILSLLQKSNASDVEFEKLFSLFYYFRHYQKKASTQTLVADWWSVIWMMSEEDTLQRWN